MARFLEALVGRLPAKAQPYAKALVPLGVAAAVVFQDLTVNAAEVNSLAVAAGGCLTALLVVAIPNRPTS